MAQTPMAQAARILLVDDDPDLLQLMAMRLRAAGHEVQLADSAEAALAQLAVALPALVVSDMRLPGRDGLQLFDDVRAQHPTLPFILLTAHGSIPGAVQATTRGAFAYLTKPFDGRELLDRIGQALQLGTAAGSGDEGAGPWPPELSSRSPQMAELLARARRIAATDASVLITGDSGSGKEVLARAIHGASPRARKPFVAVNCGAIPEALLESELFGHVKGSFTGAQSNREGLVPAAHGGSLFLDEIGDMPLALQVKLLRVLQERQVRPVGSNQSVAVDVRVLSATHQDLELALAEGRFRPDLYYRLNVVRLRVPPLAERREDIPGLALQFLRQLSQRYRRKLHGFAPEAMQALLTAPWPGNVRQLYNAVEQVCALSSSSLIPLSLVQAAIESPRPEVLNYERAKQRFERDYLSQVLKLTGGNVAEAARLAERNRTEFYRLLNRHGLEPRCFRDETPEEPLSGTGDRKNVGESNT